MNAYLLLPLEILPAHHLVADQTLHDVSVVDGDGQQGLDALPLPRFQVSGHEVSQLAKQFDHVFARGYQCGTHVEVIEALRHILVEHNLSLKKQQTIW